MVCNHQRVGAQVNSLAIQQLQGFASACGAHHNTLVQRVQIEGMHRLAEFEQHVVGDIHHRIDAAQTAAAEFFLQPKR